jgi:hypothetical protein
MNNSSSIWLAPICFHRGNNLHYIVLWNFFLDSKQIFAIKTMLLLILWIILMHSGWGFDWGTGNIHLFVIAVLHLYILGYPQDDHASLVTHKIIMLWYTQFIIFGTLERKLLYLWIIHLQSDWLQYVSIVGIVRVVPL